MTVQIWKKANDATRVSLRREGRLGVRERTDHGLDVIHKLIEVDESELGLEMSELGEMSGTKNATSERKKKTQSQFSAYPSLLISQPQILTS